MRSPKVVVTGASGFIASHCIIQLLQKGYEVTGTLRNLSRSDYLREVIANHAKVDNLKFAELDLLKDAGWDELLSGKDFLLHVASPVPVKMPKDPMTVIKPAQEGTRRVLKAAKKSGVKRVVQTSSIAAICYGHDGSKQHFTEEDWSNADEETATYQRSKVLAEKEAWRTLEDSDTELVVLNPGVVLGPALEKDYGSSLEVIKKLLSGELPGCPKLGWPLVDVRDVAKLHVESLENPQAAGNRFIVTTEFMWIKEIATVLKNEVPQISKKVSTKELPNWLVKIFAVFDKATASVVGELSFAKYTSNQKARETFDWKPISNRDSIVAAAESLVALKVVG